MRKLVLVVVLISSIGNPLLADPTFPKIEGWEISEETRIFVPDDLFDYINGAAELFLTYGFEKLHVKEYIKGDQLVKVEVYDHGKPLNAFGMYSQERYQDSEFLKIGAQGYGGEGYLNFVKDKYYVKIITYNSSFESLKSISSKVADNLSGKNDFPSELSFLPEDGRKTASEKFISNNFMGLSFLNQVVTADYEVNGNNFSMFFIQQDPEQLKQLIEKYYEFARSPQKSVKEGFHEIKDPYNGEVILKWEKDTILGLVNLKDKKLRKEFLP